MKTIAIIAFAAVMLCALPAFAYQSLQELYNQAGPSGVYDKYIELDPAAEYQGDLRISEAISARLVGNGALIHGAPNNMAIGVWLGRLDISGCIISGAAYGIYYTTNATGDVYNNTVTDCSQYGIAAIYTDNEAGFNVWNNIITDCYLGFYCIEEYHPLFLGYNTVYGTTSHRYAEFCPG